MGAWDNVEGKGPYWKSLVIWTKSLSLVLLDHLKPIKPYKPSNRESLAYLTLANMDGYEYPIRKSIFQCSNYSRIWDILTTYYEKVITQNQL